MRPLIRFQIPLPAVEIAPTAEDILRQQGVPSPGEINGPVLDCAADAGDQCLQFMKPQGILQEISLEDGIAMLVPEGVMHPEAPLPGVMGRADHLALFAVTMGSQISLRIRSLFTAGDYPLASALDAAASLAADNAALAASRTFASRIADFRSENPEEATSSGALSFLPYSPGYCGWAVSGQRALFAALEPAEIGLTLNESCLMEPLKSVSGIILGGPPEIHVFRPDFPFCTQCTSRECVVRMASVLKKGSDRD